MKLSYTVVFIVLGSLGLLTIAGAILLIALGDNPGPLFAFVTPTLATITGFGMLFVKQNNIELKVNGNLSKLIDAAVLNPAPGSTEVAQKISAETGIPITTGTVSVSTEGPVIP